jgi:orotate phosphoribosyltransferase
MEEPFLLSPGAEQQLLDVVIDEQAYSLGVVSQRSGRVFPIFPEPRHLLLSPHAMQVITHLLLQVWPRFPFDRICAIATAGIPFAAYACALGNIPLCYAFPQPRSQRNSLQQTYFSSFIEAPLAPPLRLLLIDDASGWGATKLPLLQGLLREGWSITGVLSVIELGRGYLPWYQEHHISMRALTSAKALLERLHARSCISAEAYVLAQSWFASTDEWWDTSAITQHYRRSL